MKYNLLAKSLIVSSLSLLLTYSAFAFEKKEPTTKEVHYTINTADIKDCEKVLPTSAKSYCDFTWGQKWDLTQSYIRFVGNNEEYKKLFESLEDLLGYDNGLLSGVGYAESRYDQESKSWAYAYGVMQITRIGYQSLLERSNAADTLIERYVDKDSLKHVVLSKPESINKVKLKSKPSFNDILEESPETAKLLVGMYNIREDKKSRRALINTDNWKNVKKPSSEELEVIIKHVFVPLYMAVEYSKEKYFDKKLPSFKKIKEDAQTNIVMGALIYDFGKRELSILSRSLDENLKSHFIWESPKAHKEKGTSVIDPDDLDFMAFGPYNAGLGATIFRLQIMHDKLNNKTPLKVKNALKRGAYFRQTRQGIRGIMQWISVYDNLEAISNQFRLEQSRQTDHDN